MEARGNIQRRSCFCRITICRARGLGVVTLNSSKGVVEKTLNQIVRDAEDMIDGEVVNADITYI